MSNSMYDILKKRSNAEPPEIALIKSFVQEYFKLVPNVTIASSQIIIEVPNSALAGSLRMKLFELQKLLDTNKRLVIRIC